MPDLIHSLVIERATAGAEDDYGHPSQVYAPIAVVDAYISVKSGRERVQLNQAGPVRGQYRIFMYPADVTEADHLVRQEPPEVYEITFAPPLGPGPHHMELDADRVYP